VLALFRELANAGTTVVIATHDRDIAGLSDRSVELVDGALAAAAAPPAPTVAAAERAG